MSSAWRSVRVFISSTFRDMHAERDHLIKVTFPALREKLLPHRVELYDIDLRWGITEDEARNEKVISLCLEQVDDCRPFFLGFLGHRYGWVPDHVPHETQQHFPFVQRFPGVSVTELEVRHGAMLDPTDMHTLVLLRKEEAVTSIPEAIRKRDYQEPDHHLQEKLAALKQELESGPYAVQPYSAVWDPERYDRVNRAQGKLVGLNDFGKQVEDWLWNAIRKQLQLPETPAAVDPLDAEADLHERFLELRTRIYAGRDDLYRELRTFALASGETPLLLTGESGLGKSAALARFVRDFRKDHPDVLVLPHFVGASPRTTSLAGMLQWLTRALVRKFNLSLPKAESPEEIIRTFAAAVVSLPKSTRVVLVFDALNQLETDSRAESLAWLPKRLPPNVRVLCSSTTGPQQAPRVLTAFGEREHVGVPLRPLSDGERRAIVKAVPKLVAKTLDDKQIDALLANLATCNPLFLMTALEELRGYGSFARLRNMIAGLPRDGDAVTKLFDQVLERLEQEFNKPLVDWTLRFLACSRRGLSGPELVKLTRNLGEQAEDLYPVLRQLRPYLQVRDGLFDYYHVSIRRAVEIRYLRWNAEEDQRDPWARWKPDRQPPASAPTEPERETRERLSDHFGTDRLAQRSVDELPWQLVQLRDWPQLFDLLAEQSFLEAAWATDEYDVREAWGVLEAASPLRMVDAYRPVLRSPEKYRASQIWSIAALLQRAGHRNEALVLCGSLMKSFRDAGNEAGVSETRDGQVVNLAAQGRWDQAMKLLREQESSCRRRNDFSLLARCLGHQAMIRSLQGDRDASWRLHQEEEQLYQRLGDSAGAARSRGNQAMLLHERGESDSALRTLRQVEQIWRLLKNAGQLARTLGNQAIVLQAKGDYVGALAHLQEAEDNFRRTNDPEGLAATLNNRSCILTAQGLAAESDSQLEEARSLSATNSDPRARCLIFTNPAKALLSQGDLDGASRLFRQVEVLAGQINDLGRGAEARLGQGSVLLQRGRVEDAIELFQQAEAIYGQLGEHSEIATCMGLRAEVLASRGQLDVADELLQQVEAICRQINDPTKLAACLGCRAGILYDRGEINAAMQLHQQQEQLCRASNNLSGLARSLGGQAVILQAQKKWTEALDLHREIERRFRSLKDVDGIATCLANQAHILAFGQGNFLEARTLAEEATQLIQAHNLQATAVKVMPIVSEIRSRLRSS